MSPSTDSIITGDVIQNSTHLRPVEDYLSSAAGIQGRAGGSFSDSQNLAIHVIALVASSVSLVTVLVGLRWFLLMRRSFRHRLIMHLILSDTFKAIWYFVFSVVTFTVGPVHSTSSFCQASGFFLHFSMEACDMAIFIIALHSILCIARPNSGVGGIGLYPYRNWIYPLWLCPPLLATGLAFVDTPRPYVTAGTFCFLPKRPFWYRLALSWVPRYIIIIIILAMYVWIYIYIHVKLRGFENLGEIVSSCDSTSDLRDESQSRSDSQHPGRYVEKDSSEPNLLRAPGVVSASASASEVQKGSSALNQSNSLPLQPWENMTFATTRYSPGEIFSQVPRDVPSGPSSRYGSSWSGETRFPSVSGSTVNTKLGSSCNTSARPSTVPESSPGDSEAQNTSSQEKVPQGITVGNGGNDQLKQTRIAIRKQLRYLFIYPLVYIIMWSFPFASHALTYNNYYVMHPVYWLAVMQTLMLCLQAGVDSIIFSWMERPWRRIDGNSKFSMPAIRRRSKAFLNGHCAEKNTHLKSEPSLVEKPAPVKPKANPNWWEAEGRRRNDSVWMGTSTYTDTISPVISRMRTRSKSPEKPTPGPLHLRTRTRSSEKQTNFVPTLQAIPTDKAPSVMATTDSSNSSRDASSTPSNPTARVRGHRHSTSTSTISPPPTVPEAEGDAC
ncbi:hypothetical protein LTR84_005315 [Exophiala bonariae]|uniref:G-protein coupled receptors family 1 profile domain-containing protein n=1 Tax=Exophiala bonariae TaxID=1690606 RepID=A0AAV9N498_9EURO|nr:hypothetical protein LTR84_005315 [Exophiala bonariae]